MRRSTSSPRSLARRRATGRGAVLAGLLAAAAGRAVRAQDTAVATRSRYARVIGVVVDSLHGTSLANAVVEIDGANRSARTDVVGGFRIDSVLPGKFRLGVFHPLLDSIGVGIASPLLTARAGDSLLITLATPSAPTLAALACRDMPAPVGTLANPQTTGPGVIMGRVLDADSDEPVPNVVVAYTWMEIQAGKQVGFHRTRHTRDALTGAGGDFHLCHLPVTLSGSLHAGRRDGGAAAAVSAVSRDLSPDGHVLTLVTLHLPALSTVTIADLAATAAAPDGATPAAAGGAPSPVAGAAPSDATPPPTATSSTLPAAPSPGHAADGVRARDSAIASGKAAARPQVRRYAVGTAVLTGKVIDPQARPVVSARVYVMGAADSAKTDDNGLFALRNLPSGSRTIVVRAVGFEPVTQPVELTIREALHVVVPFTARAVPVLKAVQVVARLDAGLKTVGFAQRQKMGMGTFWTLPDIEKHKAYDFHDLFTTFPGLRVDYNEQGRASLMATRGAGGCLGYNSSGHATPGANCGPCVAYVVDGSTFTENEEGEMDTYVHPGDIGAIEVYQPNSVPRSIAGVTQGDCLNIIIWTKAKLGV